MSWTLIKENEVAPLNNNKTTNEVEIKSGALPFSIN